MDTFMTPGEFENDELIRRYLDRLVSSEDALSGPLPSADFIWWRAQLAEKRQLAQRSVKSIDAMRNAALAIAAAFAILIAILWAPRLFQDLQVPVWLTLSGIVLFFCSSGAVLFAWGRRR